MPLYTCHRCNAAVEKSATDCAACGKPILPVPWSLRFRRLAPTAPDVQVVDQVRRFTLLKAIHFMVLWCYIVYGGVMVATKVQEQELLEPLFRERIRSMTEESAFPADLGDRVELFAEAASANLALASAASRVLVIVGCFGVLSEVYSYAIVRRVWKRRRDEAEDSP